MRLAGPQQVPWEEGTEIKNVSATGLAFTAPLDLLPKVQERIRIQFSLPGGESLATFAKVVRIDKMHRERALVATEFDFINLRQKQLVLESLIKRAKLEQSTSSIYLNIKKNWSRKEIFLFSLKIGLSFILLIALYHLFLSGQI